MSLACLVCHIMDSPSRSFRSYSLSSSEDEGRCAAVTCLTRKVTVATGTTNAISTSKVTPFPMMATGQGMSGTPRLLRSRAVSRDLVRDWNFDQLHVEG
ncbi:hypothetical protein GW17_00007005 [Ensete ventricosum]|nr:hypothetical protein GW17_00007005 [Ensete ventricosum]